MSIALNKFEKTVVFAGFIATAGVLVGGAYVVNTFIGGGDTVLATSPTAGNENTTLADVQFAVANPSIAQPTTKPVEFVATPLPVTQPVMTVATAAPATQPAVVMIAAPTTKPIAELTAAPDAMPAETPVAAINGGSGMITRFAIPLPAARVTHMYASDADGQPTWYEMKLDPQQMTDLTSAANAIATANRLDADEFDHLAVAWPRPEITLTWWRPAELIDPGLLVVGGQSGTQLWIAMSRRTGRTFFHASKPVDLTAPR